MKVTRMSKRLGRTITDRETFSSIKMETEVEILLDQNEDPIEAEQKLFDLAETALANDIQRIREKRKKKDEPPK